MIRISMILAGICMFSGMSVANAGQGKSPSSPCETRLTDQGKSPSSPCETRLTDQGKSVSSPYETRLTDLSDADCPCSNPKSHQ